MDPQVDVTGASLSVNARKSISKINIVKVIGLEDNLRDAVTAR
jgi:hypothetical protein